MGRALRELCGVGKTVRLSDSTWWAEVVGRAETFAPGAASRAVRGAIASVASAAEAVHVRVGPAHLDWAPWNMARSGDGLAVWDWEQFSEAVPIGYDAVHYAIQDLVVVQQLHPTAAFARTRAAAPDLLRPLGVEPGASDTIVLLYLLDLASRYLVDGESGTRLSRLDAWAEEVLETFDLPGAGA